MTFKSVVLGSGGSYPTSERNPTSVYCTVENLNFLVDGGEGFQRSIFKYKLPFFLDLIIITHYHIDHFVGVGPYLSTMNLLDRKVPLKIYCPDIKFFKEYLNSLRKNFEASLSYKLELIEIIPEVEYVEKDLLTFKFFEVNHTILTYGLLIESIHNTSYNRTKLKNWGTQSEIKNLIRDGSYEKEGVLHRKEDFIDSEDLNYRVLFSADTTINSRVWSELSEETLLFHQCTHTHKTDVSVSKLKAHTHYFDLLSKLPLKNKVILYHLGSKVTKENVKNLKKPKNFIFAEDGLEIIYNYKKKDFLFECLGISINLKKSPGLS